MGRMARCPLLGRRPRRRIRRGRETVLVRNRRRVFDGTALGCCRREHIRGGAGRRQHPCWRSSRAGCLLCPRRHAQGGGKLAAERTREYAGGSAEEIGRERRVTTVAFASMFLCVVVCLRSLRERTMRQMRVFFVDYSYNYFSWPGRDRLVAAARLMMLQ